MQIFLGILLLVMSVFLVIAILMQNAKSKRLSGTIAGGAETFFGKEKSRTIDAVLSKVTTIVAILFILAVIIVYVAFGSSYQEYITPDTNNTVVVPNADAETPVETPDAETETPEAPIETPAETPAETPEADAEAPAETPAETPDAVEDEK